MATGPALDPPCKLNGFLTFRADRPARSAVPDRPMCAIVTRFVSFVPPDETTRPPRSPFHQQHRWNRFQRACTTVSLGWSNTGPLNSPGTSGMEATSNFEL